MPIKPTQRTIARVALGLGLLFVAIINLTPEWNESELPSAPPTVTSPPAEAPSEAQQAIEARLARGVKPKIPLTILQADAHDAVTRGMLGAMKSVMGNAAEFTHRYYSESRARDYIVEHEGLEVARIYDTIVAIPVKVAFFALVYLAHDGGVFVAPFVTAVGRISKLVDVFEDDLVVIKDADGSVETPLLASVPKNPAIMEAVKLSINGFKANDAAYGTKPLFGLTKVLQGSNAPRSVRAHAKESWVALPYDLVGMQLVAGYRGLDSEHRRYHGPRALYEVVANKVPAYFRHFTAAVLEKPCPFGMRTEQMLGPGSSGLPFVQVDMRPVHPRRKTPDTPSRIPRVMFQTSKGLRVPVLLRQAMQSIIDLNPTMEHRYFTDGMQEEYVRLKASPAVLKAYQLLIPHAFRSDLFRYVYLLNEGGCYFDSDFVAATRFEQLLDSEVEFISAEDNGIGFLYNAIMCATPKHPLMRLALNMSVTRILSHFYDHSALSITGPGLFGDAFDQLYGMRPREFRQPCRRLLLLSFRRNEECGCGLIRDANGNSYFATAYPEFRSEMKAYHQQRPYWTYVEHRAVYVDGDKTLPEETAPEDQYDLPA